jgi:hypothetical protein
MRSADSSYPTWTLRIDCSISYEDSIRQYNRLLLYLYTDLLAHRVFRCDLRYTLQNSDPSNSEELRLTMKTAYLGAHWY